MSVELLTEHHLEVLSLKGGCTDSSESTLVKMPHCWKSHVVAQMFKNIELKLYEELRSQSTSSLRLWTDGRTDGRMGGRT